MYYNQMLCFFDPPPLRSGLKRTHTLVPLVLLCAAGGTRQCSFGFLLEGFTQRAKPEVTLELFVGLQPTTLSVTLLIMGSPRIDLVAEMSKKM